MGSDFGFSSRRRDPYDLGKVALPLVGVAALGVACHLAVSVGCRADLRARHGAGLGWGPPRTLLLPGFRHRECSSFLPFFGEP
jgi:hypothetical protein